jgi:Protein of unknown function (DUF4238)
MTSLQPPQKSQYHHFIPRFILRNFAHPYQPPNNPQSSTRQRRRKDKNGYRPGEPMLHVIKLAENAVDAVETSVFKTFGITDMYRDFADASNQHRLEEKLSKLESQAASIVIEIRKAFEAGQQDVWITRPRRDTLRKFLFIMKYRSSTFHRRFYHQNMEDYSSDDKQRLLNYMQKKGHKKPVDVWFDNIDTILDLKMDPELKWMKWLMDHIYPDDAKWFIAHAQMYYLALCTPSGQDEEFLLTENAYSIHEGPVTQLMNSHTNELETRAYTEFHMFAVISPKLMIVLRSFILPLAEEDADEEMKAWRETMFRMNANQHLDPQNSCSILEDLPVTKPRNSYSRLVDGRTVPLDGHDGKHRLSDKFCFRFFPISTEHTNRINSILLEESYRSSTIVYKSQLATRRTLETYLILPCEMNGRCCFKIVGYGPDDPKLMFLRKLEQAARILGSNATAVYRAAVLQEKHAVLGRILGDSLPVEPTKFMKLYMKTGWSNSRQKIYSLTTRQVGVRRCSPKTWIRRPECST